MPVIGAWYGDDCYILVQAPNRSLDDVTIGSADACEAISLSVLIRLTGLVEDLTSEEKHSNESKLL